MEPADGPRPGRAGGAIAAPEAPAGPTRPRPYVARSAGDPRGGPVPRRPRFTPRQEPRRPVERGDEFVRAVIGDQIRIPVMWCQFGSCIARYTHPRALGERDLRARALAAGWRYDALGRLACPDCAQHDTTFWARRPPALVRRAR
jgi:hypothetical protein